MLIHVLSALLEIDHFFIIFMTYSKTHLYTFLVHSSCPSPDIVCVFTETTFKQMSSDLARQVQSIIDENQSMRITINTLKAEIENLNARLRALQQGNKTKKTELEKLSDENNILKRRIKLLQTKNEIEKIKQSNK